MTDIDRKIAQLRRLLYATHYEDYDFIYLPVPDALTIVRILEDYRRLEGGVNHEPKTERRADPVP